MNIRKTPLKPFFFAVCCLIAWAARYYFALPDVDKRYIGYYAGQNFVIRAEIEELPEGSELFARFVVRAREFRALGHWSPLGGSVILQNAARRDFERGDIVEIEGLLLKPSQRDPRIGALMSGFSMRLAEKGRASFPARLISGVKQILLDRLNGLLPEPASSLAAGLLLGSRTSIPKEILDDFRTTGLTHILAVSGYNIVIIIAFISAVFSVFPRRISAICSIVVIIIFTLLVGASASVVRAAIMGSLGLIAKIFGRKTAGMRPLFITAFAMAMADPFIIFHDIGFQLSFAATAGILVFARRFQGRLGFLPNWCGVRDNLATTWAAQIFTFPLLIWYFRGFSAVSPAANITVLPMVPFLMMGSFLSLIFGKITAAPSWLLFKIFLAAVHFFASLPFAFIETGIS